MPTVLFDLSVLGTDARFRGIGRYVSELALGLDRVACEFSDVRVRFIDGIDWSGRAHFSRDAADGLARLSAAPAVEHHRRWAYRFRVGIPRAVRASGAELLHQGHPNVTPLGRLGALRLVTCHDLIPLRYPEHYTSLADGFARGRRWLDQRRYGSADHILAISRATASDLRELLHIDAGKISVVHNGVDCGRWRVDPARSAAGGGAPGQERPPKRYFLCVGDGDWRKNHERLFRALGLARSRLPALDLRLLWAGKLSRERRRGALHSARDAGVEGALELLGYVSDAELLELYRGALGTVFVSLAEGFGLPVLEAMAAGSAVLTSNGSSLPEIAEGAALLVDPTSDEAIAQGLVRLASDPVLAQELVTRGLARSSEFSLERQARETYEVYRSCLRKRQGTAGPETHAPAEARRARGEDGRSDS